MEVRDNVVDQLNRINRRVAAAYGMLVAYILLATLVVQVTGEIGIRIILAAGGILLLIRAVRIDLASWDEAGNVHDRQDLSMKLQEDEQRENMNT